MTRIYALLALLLMASGVTMQGQEATDINQISSEQKVYELSMLWKEMSYNFGNMDNCPGLDIDSLYRTFIPMVTETKDDFEYWKVLQRFMACFNKWLWRWKPLNWLSGGMPILAKKYKGKIRFHSDDGDPERESEIVIKQTFLNVIVKLRTEESSSNSVTATIKEENGSKMLIYTYLNIPRAEIQDRSEIHYGTAMLNVDDPKRLIGNYFTTRKSSGSMDFEEFVESK